MEDSRHIHGKNFRGGGTRAMMMLSLVIVAQVETSEREQTTLSVLLRNVLMCMIMSE